MGKINLEGEKNCDTLFLAQLFLYVERSAELYRIRARGYAVFVESNEFVRDVQDLRHFQPLALPRGEGIGLARPELRSHLHLCLLTETLVQYQT